MCVYQILCGHTRTANVFLPHPAKHMPQGEVYKVDPSTGSVVTILPRSFADDGAYIDQERGLLYVSKVVISDLLVFNVSTGGLVHSFSAPHGVAMVTFNAHLGMLTHSALSRSLTGCTVCMVVVAVG